MRKLWQVIVSVGIVLMVGLWLWGDKDRESGELVRESPPNIISNSNSNFVAATPSVAEEQSFEEREEEGHDWRRLLEEARKIEDYIQPGQELIQQIFAVYKAEDATQPPLWDDAIMVDNEPYYRYWQGEVYVFHLMAYGGGGSYIACTPFVDTYLEAFVKTAQPLPNGGLLWYYPDNYRLNRFLGPDLQPSAISQGRILGGIIRLDALQAAVLRVKLRHLDTQNARRRDVAARYGEALGGVKGLVLPSEQPYAYHVYHQYTVRVLHGQRDALRARLAEAGIGTMIYYPVPVHRLPVYAYPQGTLPLAEQAAQEALSLPMGGMLRAEDVHLVVLQLQR